MTTIEERKFGALSVKHGLLYRADRYVTDRVDRVVDRIMLAAGNITLLAVERASRGLEPVLGKSQMGFTLSGKEGETLVVREWPEEWFLPEKLVVFEKLPDGQFREPAQDTVLTAVFVGNKNMFPTAPGVGGGIHCGAFNPKALGVGITWEPCRHGQSISFMVTFAKDCTWHGTLFGKMDSQGLLRRWPWSLVA